MSVHVAIVEDRPEEAALLKEYFTKYTAETEVTFQLIHFESGEAFLDKYRPRYDIILLDIGLPKMNGMETAALLREHDETATVIFVTNMAQFAIKGYEVDAFDFVVKPVSYSNFKLKIQRALNKINTRRDNDIVISTGQGMVRLSTREIVYVEISDHKMFYHTTKGSFKAYGNLKEVEELVDKTFVRCNSCYLVNLAYVRAIRGQIAVVGGHELQISRPKKKSFIQAVNDYLGGGI